MGTLAESNAVYRLIIETGGRNEWSHPEAAEAITEAWTSGQVSTAEFADEMMRLVDADITAGYVPADVSSWSELHDHVDANEYVLEVFGLDMSDLGTELCNTVTAECDRRLRARNV